MTNPLVGSAVTGQHRLLLAHYKNLSARFVKVERFHCFAFVVYAANVAVDKVDGLLNAVGWYKQINSLASMLLA